MRCALSLPMGEHRSTEASVAACEAQLELNSGEIKQIWLVSLRQDFGLAVGHAEARAGPCGRLRGAAGSKFRIKRDSSQGMHMTSNPSSTAFTREEEENVFRERICAMRVGAQG